MARPNARWSGPWIRRTLWAFSRGTQQVTLHTRPVTATAMVWSCPAARKWKLRGAFARARRGGAWRPRPPPRWPPRARAGRGPRPHGQEGFGDPPGPGAAVAAGHTGEVHLQPAPPEGAPPERLDLTDGLYPADRHGLGHRPDQAPADADPVGRRGDREPVLPVEAPPDGDDQADGVQEGEPPDDLLCSGRHLRESDQRRHDQHRGRRAARQDDRADEPARRHDRHGQLVRFGGRRIQAVVGRQQS